MHWALRGIYVTTTVLWSMRKPITPPPEKEPRMKILYRAVDPTDRTSMVLLAQLAPKEELALKDLLGSHPTSGDEIDLLPIIEAYKTLRLIGRQIAHHKPNAKAWEPTDA